MKQMLLSNEPSFDGPIPGQSLTAEVGARPWQSPSQYTTVDEVIEYYMARMTSEDFMLQLVDVMEMGIPVTTLANTIQMSSVMEGIHTVDTGMLVLPVLMEMMMLLGDSAKIDYVSGLENPDKGKTRKSFLAKAASQYKESLSKTDVKELVEESKEEEQEDDTSSGLMARRK